ncbi:MAG TPA: phage tail tape measure protein, partial [bacterium]|nr:phage tail tape measure protein [bacterium]
MASRADIEAGRAYITLYLKNSALMKGLRSIRDEMQSLGSGIMRIGGTLAAAGASILAPLGGAVSHFASFGSELNDMSARTGEAVGSLAELKFAAEQTGAGIEDVEKAIIKQKKNGSLLTFDQMAAKIAAVQDPAERVRMAIEAWGKSGTKILPMVDSLQALRQEARDLGLVPTEEAIGMADAIGDALDKVKSVISATIFEVGAALAPMLLPALETVKNIAGWFNRWAKENGSVIRTVAMIGAGLVVAGGVIAAIGATIFGIGTAFGLVATAITGIGTVLGFLLSPVTLVVAAVAAGIVIWARFTESGRAAVQSLVDFFAPLLETALSTIRGIGDALMAGDLSLAGQIAITGLRLV